MYHLLEYLIRRQCFVDSLKPTHASQSVELRRLDWIGPLTVLASIAAVLCVRFTAVAVLRPDPRFFPFNVVITVVDTTIFVSLAVWVFRRVVLLALNPVRTFKTIAIQ